VKRIILVAVAAALFTPALTNAQNWWGDRHHHHISGDEMAIAGFAGGAVLAGIGYLVLRRRQNT
jgi:LPXTG-motif cell wall-anchored protein